MLTILTISFLIIGVAYWWLFVHRKKVLIKRLVQAIDHVKMGLFIHLVGRLGESRPKEAKLLAAAVINEVFLEFNINESSVEYRTKHLDEIKRTVLVLRDNKNLLNAIREALHFHTPIKLGSSGPDALKLLNEINWLSDNGIYCASPTTLNPNTFIDNAALFLANAKELGYGDLSEEETARDRTYRSLEIDLEINNHTFELGEPFDQAKLRSAGCTQEGNGHFVIPIEPDETVHWAMNPTISCFSKNVKMVPVLDMDTDTELMCGTSAYLFYSNGTLRRTIQQVIMSKQQALRSIQEMVRAAQGEFGAPSTQTDLLTCWEDNEKVFVCELNARMDNAYFHWGLRRSD